MPEPLDLDEIVVLMLRVCGLCFDKGLRAMGKKNFEMLESFTHRQLKALFTVGDMTKKRTEGIQLKEFAAEMDITLATASVLVETMVRKGLFDRTQSPNDRRTVRIRLTKTGANVFDRIQRKRAAINTVMFEGVAEGDREVFARVMRHLFERLTG